MSGSPVAREMTSGRAVTAIMSRIADDFITRVRDANRPAYRSRSRLVERGGRSGVATRTCSRRPAGPSPLRVRGPLSSSDSSGAYRTSGPAISPFFDIAQGAGLASATGVRPFLPPLLAGALAGADAGLDFDGTDYAFLESPAFLVAVLALASSRTRWTAPAGEPRRCRGRARDAGRTPALGAPQPARSRRDPVALGFAAVAVALGALLFAGSLAAGHEEAWPGLLAGAACAALGVIAVSGLLGRVRSRLDDSAAALLPAWADAAALLLAGVAILFPPAALPGRGAPRVPGGRGAACPGHQVRGAQDPAVRRRPGR